jgi:hypothetical protein
MTFFVKATTPPLPKNPRAVQVALLYGFILVVMAVTQLFSFEKLLVIFKDFMLPGGQPMAYFVATSVVIAEVFALPFLLRMQTSVAMRFLNMGMGYLVALFWIGISVWLIVSGSNVTNIGVFGGVVSFGPGLITVLYGFVLAVLAVWSSWGMWPDSRKR